MSQKKKFSIISFLASVKLALFLLISLAATSILGTFIPQKEQMNEYIASYGEELTNLLYTLRVIPDMYTSPWFLALLAAFAVNLIVCSLDRIPGVWQLINKDNLETDVKRLQRMGLRRELTMSATPDDGVKKITGLLGSRGWNMQAREKSDGTLLFGQKGGWTRFGVYLVHLSILVILLGAIVGSPMVAQKIFKSPYFAFKGSVMLPEYEATDKVYSREDSSEIPLGFTVHCDFFDIEYYDTGMPKEYLSKLTVMEKGEEVLKTSIEVNKPLTYKGITFYQSSYRGLRDFIVDLQAPNGATQTFVMRAANEVVWDDGNARFGILKTQQWNRDAFSHVKIWFNDNSGAEPDTFWLELGKDKEIKRPDGIYRIDAKQRYATGLEVNKDPGVWLVYSGCGLMLLGLFIAFFMSHRKIWVFIKKEKKGRLSVLVSGSANKNKFGYEKYFTGLVDDVNRQGKS